MPDPGSPRICFYSKGGHTQRAAHALASKTGADVTRLEVGRYRTPVLWLFRAVWDAGRGTLPPLTTPLTVNAACPWVVLAGPVWVGQPAGPLRSALQALSATDVPVGVLTTAGDGVEPTKCLKTCAAVLGRPLAAHVNIENRIDGTELMDTRLTFFARAMSGSVNAGAA